MVVSNLGVCMWVTVYVWVVVWMYALTVRILSVCVERGIVWFLRTDVPHVQCPVYPPCSWTTILWNLSSPQRRLCSPRATSLLPMWWVGIDSWFLEIQDVDSQKFRMCCIILWDSILIVLLNSSMLFCGPPNKCVPVLPNLILPTPRDWMVLFPLDLGWLEGSSFVNW